MIVRTLVTLAAAAVMASPSSSADGPSKPASVLDFKLDDIEGKAVELASFKGRVLLLVNTASQCGNTPQYAGLEALFQKYSGQGFAVLAFPANEFGHQEPGSNAEIRQFCSSHYNVTFPLFSKIVVKGPGIHPLYQFLTSRETNPKFAGEIGWNFDKFLVDRKGQVVARFKAGEKPESDAVVKAVEAALSAPK